MALQGTHHSTGHLIPDLENSKYQRNKCLTMDSQLPSCNFHTLALLLPCRAAQEKPDACSINASVNVRSHALPFRTRQIISSLVFRSNIWIPINTYEIRIFLMIAAYRKRNRFQTQKKQDTSQGQALYIFISTDSAYSVDAPVERFWPFLSFRCTKVKR